MEVSGGENEALASDFVSSNSSIFLEPIVFSRSVCVGPGGGGHSLQILQPVGK